jgi:hypothetical protein
LAFILPALLARYQALEDAADHAVIDQINARGPQCVHNDDAQRMMSEILAAADADSADQGR